MSWFPIFGPRQWLPVLGLASASWEVAPARLDSPSSFSDSGSPSSASWEVAPAAPWSCFQDFLRFVIDGFDRFDVIMSRLLANFLTCVNLTSFSSQKFSPRSNVLDYFLNHNNLTNFSNHFFPRWKSTDFWFGKKSDNSLSGFRNRSLALFPYHPPIFVLLFNWQTLSAISQFTDRVIFLY